MALEKLGRSATWGIAFLVSYGIVCEIVAKACSSPQTAELNAHKRAPTLMKWVNIGMGESIFVVGVAVAVDKKNASPMFWGGLAGASITYGEYLYAKKTGLESDEEPTEDW